MLNVPIPDFVVPWWCAGVFGGGGVRAARRYVKSTGRTGFCPYGPCRYGGAGGGLGVRHGRNSNSIKMVCGSGYACGTWGTWGAQKVTCVFNGNIASGDCGLLLTLVSIWLWAIFRGGAGPDFPKVLKVN